MVDELHEKNRYKITNLDLLCIKKNRFLNISYVLTLKDDFKYFFWLFTFKNSDSCATLDALTEFFSSLGGFDALGFRPRIEFFNEVVSGL